MSVERTSCDLAYRNSGLCNQGELKVRIFRFTLFKQTNTQSLCMTLSTFCLHKLDFHTKNVEKRSSPIERALL